MSSGQMAFYKQGAGSTRHLRSWVAKELGSIMNTADSFFGALQVEMDVPIIRGLQPFDIQFWLESNSDDGLTLSCISWVLNHSQ